MGHHSSTGRRTNRRSKAFFTTALIAALLLIFAPMAWPESATEAEAGPAVMRAASMIPTAPISPVAPLERVAPAVYPQVDPPSVLPVVTVAASGGTATEAGLTTGSFTVTRNAATSAALTVYYSVGGTATAGSDYVTLAGSVVIPANLVSATVTVTPLQDTIDENPETVTVTLSSDSLYTVGSASSATVTISDDDDGLPHVWVRAADDKAGEEGPTTGSFTIHRSGSTSSALAVDYSLGGTAGNGTDYASLAGSVVIPAGQPSAVVTVSPVDDTLDETNETVILTLLSRPAYSIGSPSSATVTIIDNDGVVALLANGMPTSKDACKKGGWVGFGVFKNQGDCVSYVATGGKNPPAGGGPWPVGHK